MATNIDYASDYENPSATIFHGMNDYGAEASNYQTTMTENSPATIDYDGLTKLCPLMMACAWVHLVHDAGAEDARPLVCCSGPRCAWYDASKDRCAVLSIARGR